MKVLLAKSAGFCWGVERAVESARKQAASGPVYTDGPLIHNQQMMDQLKAEGITESSSPESLTAGTLIIRAHGIPPERRDALRKLPVRLVDATCPDVAKIQGMIKKHAAQGYYTILFGDCGHAEVTGLLGYSANRGHVVNTPADVAALPDLHQVCLVSQSTQFPLAYEAIIQAVRTRFHDAVILDTICKSTKNRQQELLDMAAKVEAIVVVGGAHSANTLRLVELAATLKPTYHIQTGDQLDIEKLKHCTSVGLTAGASTPEFIIADVRKRLENI